MCNFFIINYFVGKEQYDGLWLKSLLAWGIFVTGAIVFLAAAVVAIYVEGTAQLLVLAGALVLGYLVPGYLLRKIKNGDNV